MSHTSHSPVGFMPIKKILWVMRIYSPVCNAHNILNLSSSDTVIHVQYRYKTESRILVARYIIMRYGLTLADSAMFNFNTRLIVPHNLR